MEQTRVGQDFLKPRKLSSQANSSTRKTKDQNSSGSNSPHSLNDRMTDIQHVEDQITALERISAAPKFLGGSSQKLKQTPACNTNNLHLSGLLQDPLPKSIQPSQKSASMSYLDNMVVISQRSINDSKLISRISLQQFGVARVPVVCRSINSRLGKVEIINQRNLDVNKEEKNSSDSEYLSESFSSGSDK